MAPASDSPSEPQSETKVDQVGEAARQKLGSYHLENEVGRGGMGVVYKAHDTRLGRPVAIKVLRPQLEPTDRFEREAKLLAALNHPNIASIYGFEEANQTRFLVLEWVPGETLGEILRERPPPLNEVLILFSQIAEALEAAHEKGILHRDLKPANVKVTPDGKVKLLDFGLGKELPSCDLLVDPAVATQLTETGTILGTVYYMSPEQARGKPVGKGTDIWAFGCCLYEALSGRRAFQGATFSDTIARILQAEPDWHALPTTTPEHVRLLLRRCLAKDPSRRLRDAGDVRIELTEGSTHISAGVDERPSLRPSVGQAWVFGSLAGLLAGLVFGAGILWKFWGRQPSGPENAPIRKLSVALREPLATPRFSPLSVGRPLIALSGDGKLLSYVGLRDNVPVIYVRRLDDFESKLLPGTEGAFHPFFSPSAEWLGFFTSEGLKKVLLSGGQPQLLCEASNPCGADWGSDGFVYFAPDFGRRLYRVPVTGGTPENLPVNTDGVTRWGRDFSWFQRMPGREAFVCGMSGPSRLWLVSMADRKAQYLGDELGTMPRYIHAGYLLFAQLGSLHVQPFDWERTRPGKSSVPVLHGIRTENEGAAQFAISDDGSCLAYVPGEVMRDARLVWLERKAGDQPIEARPGWRGYGKFKLSPDGRRLAICISQPARQVWIYDFVTGTSFRVAPGREVAEPCWSADGQEFGYRLLENGRQRLVLAKSDGSSERTIMTSQPLEAQFSFSFLKNGKAGVLVSYSPERMSDILLLDLKTQERRPLVGSPFSEEFPFLSPDERWMVYTSDENGHSEVYVTSFPDAATKVQISVDGGEEPIWSPRGEIFYRSGDRWYAVSVTTSPEFTASSPQLIFQGNYINIPGMSYDYDATNDRFLLLQGREEKPMTEIRVVLNWQQELRRLAPTDPQ